ncbi:MAG: hypothetical protein LBJ02_09945 [Bifidobacteriaceae bacterium]|nr:hypothetical protein [Bifidobacteriaceae bacterium]
MKRASSATSTTVALPVCVLLGVSAVISAFISGCSGGTEVASLDGAETTPPPQTIAEQKDGAMSFLACLKKAGIPAVLTDYGEAGSRVDWDYGKVQVLLHRTETGETHREVFGADTPAITAAEQDFLQDPRAAWELIIDGVDYSESYSQCRQATSYREPAQVDLDREELAKKAEIARVSNDWAQCAREHGVAEVEDAEVPVADGWQTTPTVLLPSPMAAAQVERLAEDCPVSTGEDRSETDPPVTLPMIDFAQPKGVTAPDGTDTTDDLLAILYGYGPGKEMVIAE